MTCFYGGRGRRLRNVRRLVAFCRDKKRKQIERGGDSNEKATSGQDGNAGADKWVDLTLMSGFTPAACFTMGASVLAQAILTMFRPLLPSVDQAGIYNPEADVLGTPLTSLLACAHIVSVWRYR